MYPLLLQVLSLIKVKLQTSISKSSLKKILYLDSSLGDGFSPLGLTTCTRPPFFLEH